MLRKLALVGLLLVLPGCSGGCSSSVDEISADGKTLEAIDPPKFDAQDDWPWWRGPTRDGIAGGKHTYPVEWSETKNVRWKADVPGRGLSSPIVVGNRVFLSTAEESKQVQSVLCYDRKTGDRLWRADVHQGKLGTRGHLHSTYASATLACDGKLVFAVFRHDETISVTALSVDKGKKVWQTEVGTHDAKHGFGASPVIHKELVIISADSSGSGFIAALTRNKGQIWWRKRRDRGSSYATPVVARLAGKDQLLLSGGRRVESYDPMTGNRLWSVRGVSRSACGTIVWKDDIVFASGGHPETQTIAVRADKSKEIVWKSSTSFYVASMIVVGNRLYGFQHNQSSGFAFDTDSGRIVKRMRMRGSCYGSPVSAGGHIYVPSRNGTVAVLDAESGEKLGENTLGSELDSSPTPAGGQLFLRVVSGASRRESLYCISRK